MGCRLLSFFFIVQNLSVCSFLDDIERVTSLRFLPSDVDVLKARLKTVGVSEYKFEIELGAGRHTGTEWRIIDVGGSRSQRRAFYSLVLFSVEWKKLTWRT